MPLFPEKWLYIQSDLTHLIIIYYFRVWNLSNQTILAKTTLEQPIRSCAFSADGSQLAVGMTDGSFMALNARLVLNVNINSTLPDEVMFLYLLMSRTGGYVKGCT